MPITRATGTIRRSARGQAPQRPAGSPRHDEAAVQSAVALRPQGEDHHGHEGREGQESRSCTADTNPGDNAEINSANPLGKIPCLVVDGGTAIFDSHVICEYLDSLAPSPVLFPKSGPERWKALVLGSLADGILDAALLLVYEKRFRPEDKWHAPWQQRQQAKIDRALDQLEKTPPAWGASPDYGH